MSMHFIRLKSDQCLSCSSLNPFFCSRSWSFYFCCLEVWNTFKTCWQSRSLQRFLQRVPSSFPLHCLLLDRPVKQRLCTWYITSYRIIFSMSESYMTLTLKLWSHLFRGQGGSRRGGWLLVIGGDSKTFAYMHIFAFQNNQQREQPSGLTTRLWLTSAMVPQMKVSLTSLSIFIILGLRGMVLADCWYEVSRSILGRDYWSRTLLFGSGDCWYNRGE